MSGPGPGRGVTAVGRSGKVARAGQGQFAPLRLWRTLGLSIGLLAGCGLGPAAGRTEPVKVAPAPDPNAPVHFIMEGYPTPMAKALATREKNLNTFGAKAIAAPFARSCRRPSAGIRARASAWRSTAGRRSSTR